MNETTSCQDIPYGPLTETDYFTLSREVFYSNSGPEYELAVQRGLTTEDYSTAVSPNWYDDIPYGPLAKHDHFLLARDLFYDKTIKSSGIAILRGLTAEDYESIAFKQRTTETFYKRAQRLASRMFGDRLVMSVDEHVAVTAIAIKL